MSIRLILYFALGIMLALLMVSVVTGYQQSEQTIRHLDSFAKTDESTLAKMRLASELMLVADHNFQLLTIPPEISQDDVLAIIAHLDRVSSTANLVRRDRQLFEFQTRQLRENVMLFLQKLSGTERQQLVELIVIDAGSFRQHITQLYRELSDDDENAAIREQIETVNNLLTELEIQVRSYDKQNLFDPQRVTVPLQGALTEITALLAIANAAASNKELELAGSDRIAYLVSLDESFKLRLEILSTNIVRLILAINNYIDELDVYDTSASYQLRTTELVTELEALVQSQLRQIVNELEQSINRSKQGLITSSINSQHFYFVLSMFSILISLIIAFFLGNLITGSILTLQEGAREFSAGNLKYRIDEPETREFAEVTQVFNQMAESVQQDQVMLRQNLAKLNEANRELDSRVESRTRELESAMLHATRANQAKSQFLSSMSHELRTPLNAILGFSQLFRYDDNLTEKQHGNAQKINQAGTHLLNLVDQVLDLSRIETGDFDLSFKAVNVADILQESVVWVNKQAHARSIVINFDPEPYRSLYVRADALRFRQIILNLLSNAIKYNREKGEINILLHQKDDLRLSIGIKDTGAGIPAHLLGDLFQPFNRLGAEASATEGTGIGLVISKKLARLMRGDISVETTSGEGSTFWLELQMVEPSEAPARQVSDSSIQSNLSVFKAHRKKINVLVAEDMTINQELMEAQLDFLGYSSRFARNGADALEIWKKGKHQILLTDIRMPVMDGVELTQQIRLLEKDGSNPFPIIAVTANAMNVDANRYFDAGINAIITKPVILEELDSVLEDWLAGI